MCRVANHQARMPSLPDNLFQCVTTLCVTTGQMSPMQYLRAIPLFCLVVQLKSKALRYKIYEVKQNRRISLLLNRHPWDWPQSCGDQEQVLTPSPTPILAEQPNRELGSYTLSSKHFPTANPIGWRCSVVESRPASSLTLQEGSRDALWGELRVEHHP